MISPGPARERGTRPTRGSREESRASINRCYGCCWVLLSVRLVVAVVWAPPMSGDAADYLRLAKALGAGEGFVGMDGSPTSWRPPLYPALLATLLATDAWWGEATALVTVRMVQAILATGTVWFTYQIGAKAGGRRIGLWAAAFQALNVAHIAAVSRLLSETLFTFLVTGAVALLVNRGRAPRRERAFGLAAFAGAGAMLGLAALTRSAALALPVLLLPAWLLAASRMGLPRPEALLRGAALCISFALVLAPWTARNARVHGSFVPVATQGGGTLYAGNHPAGGRILGNMAEDDRTRRASAMSEVDGSAYLASMTMEDWKENPGEALRLLPLKALYFWTPEDWELLPGSGRFNGSYAFMLFWLLALPASAILGPRRDRPRVEGSDSAAWRMWPVWALCGAWVAIAAVFYGSPRFRFPVEPILAIGAAFGLTAVLRGFGPERAASLAAVAAGGVGATVVMWNPVGTVIKSALAAVGVW